MDLQEEILRMKSMGGMLINEQPLNRFTKSNQVLQEIINKYLTKRFSKANRIIKQKSRNYGNLSESWCEDGYETIMSYYTFTDGEFEKGRILVSEELVSEIQKSFSVRYAYTMYVIEEWYDETMVPKFEEIVGENNLSISSIDTMSKANKCLPQSIKPEGITDDEMIDFIVNNTLYRKNEVMQKLESGERELEDFYLDIVDVVNRRNTERF